MEIKFLKPILIFLFALLSLSCKEKYPKTEQECSAESEVIMQIASKKDYSTKLLYLNKYGTFKKFQKDDYEKTYEKLNGFLMKNNFSDLKRVIKKDTVSLDFNDVNSKVIFVKIKYFYANSETNSDSELCMFSYSIADGEQNYILSNFLHSLQAKHRPILPIRPKNVD